MTPEVKIALSALDRLIYVLDLLRRALTRGDYEGVLVAESVLSPVVVPWQVEAARRSIRPGATVVPAPERVQSPHHTCPECGSSWLGQGECPDADMHR